MRTYSLDDVHATRKRRDSWWTVYLVDPLACRTALLVANRSRITPNELTVLSLVIGLVSALCFALDLLVAGAAAFYLSFMVDCVDGKIARLKGTGTPFGLWLDYVGDRVRVVLCATGLAYGQYALTGDVQFIVLGAGIAVLDLFRYVNAPQMKRVREIIREARAEAAELREAARVWNREQAAVVSEPVLMVPLPSLGEADDGEVVDDDDAVEHVVTVSRRRGRNRTFSRRLNRYLARRRVRSHLISGIEFHAAVFVVAPLVGVAALVPVSAVAGVLLLANEIFLVYRMWLFTRRHTVSSRQESRERVLV
ncbi:CDP-alcohol phosphatidyltransferase family protein [Nonomuraea sp. 3-1Str]|uniref:CDP-alcohol phosphatidyltransferase family protein n=1 Tax=unclassified Nonomuraea TaxID=2593643 RepID=UPI0028568C33|nr:CDP-alcohol phosphatidyltransferase family protein [Nonomuraea sp. 3-1Str]MDR8408698.1 CDP-alcohol phosphatidyltransferase family protein [Nonomuraea sp. 3-1Str]